MVALVVVVALAALVSNVLIALLFPLMRQYAMARPNARSSHSEPTPQGGGIAVIFSTVVVTQAIILWAQPGAEHFTSLMATLAPIFVAVLLLAALGAIDDIRPLGPVVKLAIQSVACILMLASLDADLHILPDWFPWILERVLLLAGALWFVNLFNFMDGIDGIAVAEGVPVALGAAALGGTLGFVQVFQASSAAGLTGIALAGALIGFWPYNQHRARLFLGDVGSLPIGLLLAWLLITLAGHGHPIAALILPMYYLADATITLIWRFRRGEKVWQAHRRHFYQRAVDSERFSAPQVTRRVWLTNILLVVLAYGSVVLDGQPLLQILCLVLAIGLVAALLQHLRRGVAR